jgi:hypothetical protein
MQSIPYPRYHPPIGDMVKELNAVLRKQQSDTDKLRQQNLAVVKRVRKRVKRMQGIHQVKPLPSIITKMLLEDAQHDADMRDNYGIN